ncbi:MAG: hypothetical protein H7Y27_14800 [Gemmatimonadaceae bacterium]|nr:hypothetical protein [Chitinophagaceae bacterium]
MKQILLIATIFFSTLLSSFAQDDAKNGNRIQALKIAYLTQKLNLTTEEAQKFWPIYNSYSAELLRIRKEQKEKNLSEIDMEDRILTIRKKYNGEFGKALSAEKINTLFRSEKDFTNYIQRELQERRMNRRLNKGN